MVEQDRTSMSSIVPSLREVYEQEEIELIHKALKAYKSSCYSRAKSKLKGAGSSTVTVYETAELWEAKGDTMDSIIKEWEEQFLG